MREIKKGRSFWLEAGVLIRKSQQRQKQILCTTLLVIYGSEEIMNLTKCELLKTENSKTY